MITIVGDDDDSGEARAARQLRDAILCEYPSLASAADQALYIFVSVQTPFCADCKNVDLYLLGKFDTPLPFTVEGETSLCYSLSATVEVKSHTPPGVWLEGDKVYVQYPEGKSAATLQAFRQVFAIRKFFTRRGFAEAPYVMDFVWLSQCKKERFDCDASELPVDAFFADSAFSEILGKALLRLDGIRNVRLLKRDFDFKRGVQILSRVLAPSGLLRRRVEALASSRYKSDGTR